MSDSMAAAIVPKSDQLNSDDLIAGPITIKITEVRIKGGQEQPVEIHYEGDNGKPYKPCKSMSRVLVSAWGADAKQYTGRSMTLYRDASVKWAGMEVGGIRISHMSDIDSAMTMALTATKGSRKPFTVRPLVIESQRVSDTPDWDGQLEIAETLDALAAIWAKIPKDERPKYAATKDARKAALQTAGQGPAKDDFVAEMERAERGAI